MKNFGIWLVFGICPIFLAVITGSMAAYLDGGLAAGLATFSLCIGPIGLVTLLILGGKL